MDENNPTPRIIPPDALPPLPLSPPPPVPPVTPPPPSPDLTIPIRGLAATAEAMLRQPARVRYQLREAASGQLIFALTVIALVAGAIYGVVVGTFSGGDQLWAAPAKIAGGLLVSGAICLPSLYIFSCLGGSRARLVEVVGLVAGLIALMTIMLIGFAPVAWVFSQSTESVAAMGALHLVFWFIATYFGLRFLKQGFGELHQESSGGLAVWTIIFLLVMVQMTTALRPLVGTSKTFFPTEKRFFLSHWWNCLEAEDKPAAAPAPASAPVAQ